jgi:hypothetical protein
VCDNGNIILKNNILILIECVPTFQGLEHGDSNSLLNDMHMHQKLAIC